VAIKQQNPPSRVFAVSPPLLESVFAIPLLNDVDAPVPVWVLNGIGNYVIFTHLEVSVAGIDPSGARDNGTRESVDS
jgi:hypothetical protein